MKSHPGHLRSEQGFALVGVLLLVAIFVILSVGAGALYLRQLNQTRQIQTQKLLETAFQGLFPGNQRSGPNMWKDFWFTPDIPVVLSSTYDLRCMTTRAQVGAVQASMAGIAAYTGNPPIGGSTLGAWNGPYWQGPVDSLNRPVDAWGRPIQLRCMSATVPSQWQVFSLGVNGVANTGGPGDDDLVYPPIPYVIPSPVCEVPTLAFSRTSGFVPAENLTISLTWAGGSQSGVALFDAGHLSGNPPPVFRRLPQGIPITVSLTSDQRGGLVPRIITIDTSCNATPSPITF